MKAINNIDNIHINIMGTISFDGKFKGMRKSQQFDIYPAQGKDISHDFTIQSDTRIGYLNLCKKNVRLTPSVSGGAYSPHLSYFTLKEHVLSDNEVNMLKGWILKSSNKEAGSSYVKCNNAISYC
jgi:hypothetical protein